MNIEPKRTRCRLLVLCTISAMFWTGCIGGFGSEPALSEGPSYDWPESSPGAQGLDPHVLIDAYEEVEDWDYIYSLLIVRNGFLVAEKYYNGRDRNTIAMMYSVTKSVTSALVGIALADGHIDSLDQKMMEFFPEHDSPTLDPRKQDITLRHLLTMQAGFEHETVLSPIVGVAPHTVAAILGSELRFDPGSGFLYSSHGSHLLSAIITSATGMSAREYAVQQLFTPIGVETVRWPADGNGISWGGAGMSLTPRDMARFGWLYLQNGVLDGVRVVSDDWIELSIQNHRDYAEPWEEMDEVGYGLQWWTGRFDSYPVHFASGYGGQWILNVPDLNMVIVATMNANSEANWRQMESLIPVISNHIIPAAEN